MASRMVASGTNALANSVVLVCRKRETDANIITTCRVYPCVKNRTSTCYCRTSISKCFTCRYATICNWSWHRCIFSFYSKFWNLMIARCLVKTALQLINAQLDEFLNDLHGDFDPETRFAATWFEQCGYTKGDYGAAA